jgi:hypothetical protein
MRIILACELQAITLLWEFTVITNHRKYELLADGVRDLVTEMTQHVTAAQAALKYLESLDISGPDYDDVMFEVSDGGSSAWENLNDVSQADQMEEPMECAYNDRHTEIFADVSIKGKHLLAPGLSAKGTRMWHNVIWHTLQV